MNTKLYKIVVFILAVIVGYVVTNAFISCKPIDVTDPTPTVNKITMYWNTDNFIQSTVELSIPYKGTISESYFRFQREDIDSKEPYVISISTFSDTVSVFDEEITEITYKKQNIPCSTYRIYSEHAVKMYAQIIVYQIGD